MNDQHKGRVTKVTALIVAATTLISSMVALFRTIDPPAEQKVDVAYDILKQKIEDLEADHLARMESIQTTIQTNREDLREIRDILFKQLLILKDQEERQPKVSALRPRRLGETMTTMDSKKKAPEVDDVAKDLVKIIERDTDDLELTPPDQLFAPQQMQLPASLEDALKKK